MCSTKRKAAKDPASGRTPRSRATAGIQPTGDDAAAAATATPGKNWKRLSDGDIRWILAQKPPARYAALKRSNPELTPRPGEEADEDKRRLYRLAKAFYEMEERLPRTQQWVRDQLEEKGFVELDDEQASRRAEIQAMIDREWPEIEARIKALVLSEKEYEKEYRKGQGGEGGESSDSDDYDEGEEEEEE